MQIFKSALAVAAASAGLALAVPAVASAAVHRPIAVVVSVNDSASGVLTTAAPLVKGEVLKLFGPATGTFKVGAVVADGPLDRVSIPGLPASLRGDVADFHIVSVPLS